MNEYIGQFREALDYTHQLSRGMSNYYLYIDPTYPTNFRSVQTGCAQVFEKEIPNTRLLPGSCCIAVMYASSALMHQGIRHTVTIGDVELADGRYVGIEQKDLIRQVDSGYQPLDRPLDAHAWITLECGTVLDATILASQHAKRSPQAPSLPFIDAIYLSSHKHPHIKRHIPMLTGMVFHQRVLTHPKDPNFERFQHWYQHHAAAMAHFDMLRLMN